MDEQDLFITEVHEATSGLGNWHKTPGDDKSKYLAEPKLCLECLKDLLIHLENDTPESGYIARLKLGEWKVLSQHLIHLLVAYRMDLNIVLSVLLLCKKLTERVPAAASDQLKLIEYMQDYKEAFTDKDLQHTLSGLIVDSLLTMDEEEIDEDAEHQRKQSEEVGEALMGLIRNLVSIPDPHPGDAGYSPLRRSLQLSYIKYFHDQGLLDFIHLHAETVLSNERDTDQAWLLLDILYHICTQLNPEELTTDRKERDKTVLKDLMERDRATTKLMRGPPPSRHGRFGTVMETKTALGVSVLSANVQGTENFGRGKKAWRKEFNDPQARTEKKRNMFHDPFFVDLEEGSVSEHNALNPLVRSGSNSKQLSNDVLAGVRKLMETLVVESQFSNLVQLLRSSCTATSTKGFDERNEYNRFKILNFVTWMLEFSRSLHYSEQTKAKKAQEPMADFEPVNIQGAIDLDMLQFVTARLREYGKQQNINPSALVIVLRTLQQQLKLFMVFMDAKDANTRNLAGVLLQNVVKEDTMAHLCWIMKNFKSTAHDPRVLSYSIEVFHHMQRLIDVVRDNQARDGQKEIEFIVEKATAARVSRKTTSASKEVESLADARVVSNMFYLLEKYSKHSAHFHSILVKLLYSIIKVTPTNIVVFFELAYFVRIHRIVSDPLVRKMKQYEEMKELLRYILRQFFKCANKNGCVFAELFFPKVSENSKFALLQDHVSEFAAILDNYENEEYKTVLDRMDAGETPGAIRERQRALLTGELKWTEQEDDILRNRYPVYQDHPLVAELLASELPEESKRTARHVKKRLQELNLIRGGRAVPAETGAAVGEPPEKKQKVDSGAGGDGVSLGPEGDFVTPGVGLGATQQDEESLEMDLERLLDAAMDTMDSDPFAEAAAPASAVPATNNAPPAATPARQEASPPAPPPAATAEGSQGVDIELELERLLEMDTQSQVDSQPVPATVLESSVGNGASTTLLDTASVAAAVATAPCATGESAEDAEEDARSFWEGIGAAAAAADNATDGAAPSSFSQSQPLELEAELEKIMDNATHESKQVSFSQSQPLELEAELEKIMEMDDAE